VWRVRKFVPGKTELAQMQQDTHTQSLAAVEVVQPRALRVLEKTIQ
jgi:hypothetical protein